MVTTNSEIKSNPQQCGCNDCPIGQCKCNPGCFNCDCASYLPKWFCWTWPSSMWWWIFWSIGAVLLGFGLVSSIVSLSLTPLIFSVPGLFIMGFASPDPFKQMMDRFVPDHQGGVWNVNPKPPMDYSQWHLNRVEWDDKVKEWLPNPLARYEQDGPQIAVNQEGEEWVVLLDEEEKGRFDSEIEASKKMEKLLKKSDKLDAQEMIFAEHPRHNRFRALFNATPPQFTSSFFHYIFAVLFLLGGLFGLPSIERSEKGAILASLIILGAVRLILSYFNNKKVMEAWDTVTSIVKFVDAGHNELVGQVRPINDTPPIILHVDGCKDKSWTFRNVVAWSWSYHATEKWTETYTDGEGKRRTRTRTETRYVRGGSHASDYLLHDGTGGIMVKTSTFDDMNMGSEIWSSGTRGKKGCGKYATPRHGGHMINHNWSLHAIAFGDPTYVMARVTNRPHDDISRGTVSENASRVHHTLMAVGEDAPRRHAKLLKGTEFSVLKPKASVFGNFGPSALLIISTLVVLMTVL